MADSLAADKPNLNESISSTVNTMNKPVLTEKQKHMDRSIANNTVTESNKDTEIVEEEEEDDEPKDPGYLSGFINSEAKHDWLTSNTIDFNSQLSANFSSLLNLQLSSQLSLGAEFSFETEGKGQYLAFESPSLLLNTLTVAYSGELGGIGLGKFNHLNEDNLVDPIWNRQLNLFDNLPSSDLDISEVLGLRAWLDLSHFIKGDHYIYGGVFMNDPTALGRSLFSQRRFQNDNFANSKHLKSWMISLHGYELPFAESWEYAIGLVNQAPERSGLKRELSVFSGIYGDYELDQALDFSPMAEVLYQNNVEGKNQSAISALFSMSVDTGSWVFGASYSHRHLIDHDNNEETSDDNEAQVFTSYYFDSGLYVDFGYQFLKEEGEVDNAFSLALGIPYEFSANLYGAPKAAKPGLARKSIKKNHTPVMRPNLRFLTWHDGVAQQEYCVTPTQIQTN